MIYEGTRLQLWSRAMIESRAKLENALIDTGSGCNLILKKFCKSYGMIVNPVSSLNTQEGFAGNTNVAVKGEVRIRLQIGPWDLDMTFFMVDCKHIIVGIPQLK